MKRVIFLLIISLLAAGAFALQGEVVYLDGTVDYRSAGGPLEYADFGTVVGEGDSIITGRDGYCEIELPNGSTVKIGADSVFTYQVASVAPDREPENVFDVVRGQVAFRFNNLGADEPSIRSRGAVAGVRGTEFTVVAGEDGQSLFVIAEGAVEVSSKGSSVSLGQAEAVEVSLEKGVGEKFPALDGEIDFTAWRDQRQAAAKEDPTGTLVEMIRLMESYLDAAHQYKVEFDAAYDRQQDMQTRIADLRNTGKNDDADKMVQDEFLPNKDVAMRTGLNYRYYALSAQNLRRYVISELYIYARSLEYKGGGMGEFMIVYDEFLEIYENRAVDFFVKADI